MLILSNFNTMWAGRKQVGWPKPEIFPNNPEIFPSKPEIFPAKPEIYHQPVFWQRVRNPCEPRNYPCEPRNHPYSKTGFLAMRLGCVFVTLIRGASSLKRGFSHSLDSTALRGRK